MQWVFGVISTIMYRDYTRKNATIIKAATPMLCRAQRNV